MNTYQKTIESLRANPRTWLITGVAGFIGSHLLETLLLNGQTVVGLDNFVTGDKRNFDDVREKVGDEIWQNFRFIEGSVADIEMCREAVKGVDSIFHEAGFISVPQSLEEPLVCNATNVDGTLNLLVAAKDAGVKRFVYASSSAIYGDDETMPKVEHVVGRPLSPYGSSKLIDELYANVFFKCYGLKTVGLRYFNVFGPRQNPKGGYAAVIPAWISALVENQTCHINGYGWITRDFVHVQNVVQANILAATTENETAFGEAFNVGNGGLTSLENLYKMISTAVGSKLEVVISEPRAGDILHSGADISKIQTALGYEATITVDGGMDETVKWYIATPRG